MDVSNVRSRLTYQVRVDIEELARELARRHGIDYSDFTYEIAKRDAVLVLEYSPKPKEDGA